MSTDQIKSRIEKKLAMAHGLDAVILLDFGDDGQIAIDAKQNPPAVSEKAEDPDLTLSCAREVFENILNGAQDPTMAYMTGKLKIRGSMPLAMKLNAILED